VLKIFKIVTLYFPVTDNDTFDDSICFHVGNQGLICRIVCPFQQAMLYSSINRTSATFVINLADCRAHWNDDVSLECRLLESFTLYLPKQKRKSSMLKTSKESIQANIPCTPTRNRKSIPLKVAAAPTYSEHKLLRNDVAATRGVGLSNGRNLRVSTRAIQQSTGLAIDVPDLKGWPDIGSCPSKSHYESMMKAGVYLNKNNKSCNTILTHYKI